MAKEIEVSIPHWTQLTVEQFQGAMEVFSTEQATEDPYYAMTKILQLFLGIEHEDVMAMSQEQAKTIYSLIVETINSVVEYEGKNESVINQISIKHPETGEEVAFGMVPNLEKMSFGEFIDLDTYFPNNKDLHKMMAVLFRPITRKWKDTYEIEPYEGSDKYAEVMKQLPARVALNSRVFFYRLGTKLPIFMQHYLSQQTNQEHPASSNLISELNGAGTQAFIDSQRAHLLELTTLLNSQSIKL